MNENKKNNQSPMAAAKKEAKTWLSGQGAILLIEGFLLLAVSVFMFMKPVSSMTILVSTFGIVMTAFGLYLIIKTILNKNVIFGITVNILLGVSNLIFGIFLLMNPTLSFTALVFIAALAFIVRSIYLLVVSIKLSSVDSKGGIYGIILAIMSLVLSLFIMFYPMDGAIAVLYYLAICLIFYAITNFVLFFKILGVQKRLN